MSVTKALGTLNLVSARGLDNGPAGALKLANQANSTQNKPSRKSYWWGSNIPFFTDEPQTPRDREEPRGEREVERETENNKAGQVLQVAGGDGAGEGNLKVDQLEGEHRRHFIIICLSIVVPGRVVPDPRGVSVFQVISFERVYFLWPKFGG